MTESLQLRNEHSRSFEDAERFKALDTLTELGMLTPLSDLEVHHGRVARAGEDPWRVDPAKANGGNDSGNNNVHARPTLYTGDRQTAHEFAESRRRNLTRAAPDASLRAETHRIVSQDSDARIIDLMFNPLSLSRKDRARYDHALKQLILPITEGSPVGFQDRHQAMPIISRIRALQKSLVSEADAQRITRASGGNGRLIDQLAGGYNAMQVATTSPTYLASKLLTSRSDIITDEITVGQAATKVPLNLEYAARYFRHAHIVGVRDEVLSATVGKRIETVALFDLERVNTPGALQEQRQHTWKSLGALANLGEKNASPNDHPLMRRLDDPHASPEKLVEDARKVPGYDKLFDASTGVWEGFTLAEHTETVLRNFEENYADRLPVALLKPMRLAIITHDIGKPVAEMTGEQFRQKDYNRVHATDFMKRLGVEPKMQELLLELIGDGQEYAYRMDVKKEGPSARAAMKRFAWEAMRDYMGPGEVNDDQVEAFTLMCRTLHACDGGAYTSMAITRRASGGRYRNSPRFNASFAAPVDLSRRGLTLHQAGRAIAPKDLTPRR